jgi:peroxiredoxin
MAISVGDKLPDVQLAYRGEEGPEFVSLGDKLKGRRVVIFALPGAFTPTCSSAHLPSFIRTKAQFDAKGVDEIICISVNDIHVMKLWAEMSGAEEAGITMLADPAAEYTKAVGMSFTAEPVGFIDRSVRYALYAEDGVVKVINVEEGRGVCELSGGETMLDELEKVIA